MPNGKPGDHPRTDLTIHNMVVYGEPLDGMLKTLIESMGQQPFDKWFNPLWLKSNQEIEAAARAKLQDMESGRLDQG